MGYKSVVEAIERFEQREREELIKKRVIFDNFKTDEKFIDILLKLLKEQIKTYRYCRYSCYVIKKKVKDTTGEYEKFTRGYEKYFSDLEIYLEELRHDSNTKIKILKLQKKLVKKGLTSITLRRLYNLYKTEIGIIFKTSKMAAEFEDFTRKIQEIIERNKEYAKKRRLLNPEQIRKLEIIIYKLNTPILKFHDITTGKYAPTLFTSLSIISEGLNLLRWHPLAYGLKVAVDMPKEAMRSAISSRAT